jgi:phosphopantothenoylcysteine decarboxylase / phosphopantothenate---cysteine ligase
MAVRVGFDMAAASHTPSSRPGTAAGESRARVLITAGPTHEPIDAVRFIGNRSSGRVGVALAEEAARRGWDVTLLLGPTHRTPADSRVLVVRFRTAEELDGLLASHAPRCDVLVMAAAVADYRPKPDAAMLAGKLRRTEGPLTLELEPTPDLLARVAAGRRPGQVLVGFALEPRAEMLGAAKRKLERKGVDLIVANPLETMDGELVEAVVIGRDGSERRTPGVVSKEAFAPWLWDVIGASVGAGR